MNGAANAVFGAIIIVGEGLHRNVFAVVFQGDEEFIADGQVVRFASGLVQCAVGGLQYVEHQVKDGFSRSDAAFEFFVGPLQFFLYAGHLSSLTGKGKMG